MGLRDTKPSMAVADLQLPAAVQDPGRIPDQLQRQAGGLEAVCVSAGVKTPALDKKSSESHCILQEFCWRRCYRWKSQPEFTPAGSRRQSRNPFLSSPLLSSPISVHPRTCARFSRARESLFNTLPHQRPAEPGVNRLLKNSAVGLSSGFHSLVPLPDIFGKPPCQTIRVLCQLRASLEASLRNSALSPNMKPSFLYFPIRACPRPIRGFSSPVFMDRSSVGVVY
jgi:hypothetical protein